MVQILTQEFYSIYQYYNYNITLYLSAFASKNLFCRYTHTNAEWYMHEASHCFVVSKAKVENNLNVYQ